MKEIKEKDAEITKLASRVQELEVYCDQLANQLTQWTELDKKSQLLVNKLEEPKVLSKSAEKKKKTPFANQENKKAGMAVTKSFVGLKKNSSIGNFKAKKLV